jgi:cytochrome bd-type quinol oxidase subunit 2
MVMFWVSLLAISILLYVLLDGFDLGIGMLMGLPNSEAGRDAMLSAVSPIWDGNETWLVVTGVILWGAFSIAYATLLSAFYLPLLTMLAGLILRGVAFEYRHRAKRTRWIWNMSFVCGSFAAAFIQGLTIGALVVGLPITNGQYAGGDFGWFSLFAVLCGLGLCLGYTLLGACWLVKKCEGDLRTTAYRLIPYLSIDRAAHIPRSRLYLFAGRKSSGDGEMDGAAVSFRLPHSWRAGGSRARGQCPIPPRRFALSDGYIDLRVGLWCACHLVLALHGPFRPDHQ